MSIIIQPAAQPVPESKPAVPSHQPIRAAILGATGYAGRELLLGLARHPSARVARLISSGRGGAQPFPIEQAHPRLRTPTGLPGGQCEPWSPDILEDLGEADVVFLATPHEVSHRWIPKLLEHGTRVIDLSGAFRLKDAGAYPRWYGFSHKELAALAEAIYGLPELNAEAVGGARLVANPGCYATSVILALAPLVRAGWIDMDRGIVCDAKSGASGAGREARDDLHFAEVNENCRAYSPLRHRHVPEIVQALGLDEPSFTFMPHLLPVTRGILSTVYVRLASQRDAAEVQSLYQTFYAGSPLVRVYSDGTLPEIQAVAYTPFADLGFALDEETRRLIIISALDNLGKGAATQAIQNMNLMFGLPQETGLLQAVGP